MAVIDLSEHGNRFVHRRIGRAVDIGSSTSGQGLIANPDDTLDLTDLNLSRVLEAWITPLAAAVSVSADGRTVTFGSQAATSLSGTRIRIVGR